MGQPDIKIHITRVSGDDVYGHETCYCDESGCSGNELYWRGLRGTECRKGEVVEYRDADGVSEPALNDYERSLIEGGDLLEVLHIFMTRTKTSAVVARRVVYGKWRELQGLPEPTVKFFGQFEESELPIKPGMMITIRKGTVIQTTDAKQREKIATKTYKVRVHHILVGVTRHLNYHREVVDFQNPRIRWVGTGGYWYDADINDIPEALS